MNMNTGTIHNLQKLLFEFIFYCRHVVLPKEMVKLVPETHLMTEEEWRGIGVQQSKGWIHYMIHKPGKIF